MTYSTDDTKNANEIGDDRARALTKVLGDAPDPTDPNAVRRYLADLADAGLHVLFVHPATKVPADPRPTPEKIAADRAFREAAVRSGSPQSRVHLLKAPAGHNLASNEIEVLTRYHDQYRKDYPRDYPEGDVPVNLGVKLGPSRLVVVDCDTADQVSAFLADAGAPADLSPTIASPGVRDDKGNWPHRDGGHFWFVVPEDVELPATIGTFTAAGEYAVMWGERYVLIPPSTRKEGSYTAPGEVHVLPERLREQIVARGRDLRDRAERCGAGEGSTSITAWSQSQTWAEILGPSWTPTGRADSCGCETWTAPGEHGSPKSATAHEIGCTIAQHDPDNPPLHFWTTGDRGQFSDWPRDNISKLQAVALSEYGNDMGDAMTALDLFDDGETVMLDDRTKPTPGSKGRVIELISADEIEDDAPTWVWEYEGAGRMMLGTLAIFAGRPAVGKSTAARWLAAGFTTGAHEGCFHGKPQNVAYIATEESWRHMIKPSLRAAGADMRRVKCVQATSDGRESKLLAATDEGALTEAFIAAEVSIVVLDPLMGTVDGKTDIYRNNETREVLDPWRRIAEKIGGLVIGIAHLTKAPSGDIVAAIQGSSAFGEVARSVFGFAKDGDGNRIMSQAKNSAGREDLAVEYTVDPIQVTTDTGKAAEVARFEITGKSDRDVGDVLREQARGGRSSGGGAAVGRWLADYLADGPRWAAAGIAAGEREGYSKDRLKRARLDCGIESVRDGKEGRWYWATPEQIKAEARPADEKPVTLADDPVLPKKINPFPGPSSTKHGHQEVN